MDTKQAERAIAKAPSATPEQMLARIADIDQKSQARITELAGADPVMRELSGMRKGLQFAIEGPQLGESDNGSQEDNQKEGD